LTDADQDKTSDGALLITMRESYLGRDFDRTLAAFEQLVEMVPRAARSMLRPIMAGDYTKAIHDDFLAHALLDLRNDKEVARVCLLADALLETEQPLQGKSID